MYRNTKFREQWRRFTSVLFPKRFNIPLKAKNPQRALFLCPDNCRLQNRRLLKDTLDNYHLFREDGRILSFRSSPI